MNKLAIDGGAPVRTTPFPARVQMDKQELKAVVDLVEASTTGALTFDRYGGEQVDTYEREFADYFGMRFGTAMSAGTAAVHSALAALRPEIGSEIISAPITDPGGVAPILMMNCIPIFADADPETFNMDPKSVEERISDRTKAIIAAHIAGQPCDMDPIMELAEAHHLIVIEDVSQSHDALYKGRKAGTIGHIGAFSLMSGKHTTAGGQGGMVITNDEELYWNAKRFADRGKPFNSEETSNIFLGLNYRMTELEAAIGRVQLKKLPQIIGNRRKAAAQIGERIADLKTVRMGKVIEGAVSSYWFLFLHVDEAKLKISKNDFAKAVAAEGVPASPAYDNIVYEQGWIRNRQTYGQSGCPWTCPFYGKEVTYEGSCPNARKAIDTHMVMAVHECYTEQEADDIAEALRKVEQHYLR